MLGSSYFQRKTVNINKLLNYGFVKKNDSMQYSTAILDGQFELTVIVSKDANVNTRVVDNELGEEYILYKAEDVVGAFVGEVKSSVEAKLLDIANKCFDLHVFNYKQSQQIIDYIHDAFNDELEYLWKKSPYNAICRRSDNKKWYAIIMTVPKSKLGFNSDEVVEIIDLRLEPKILEQTIDNKRYFYGWHMNKKNWYTIILDGSVDTKELCNRIDISYQLSSDDSQRKRRKNEKQTDSR